MRTTIECKNVGIDPQHDFDGDLTLTLTVHDMNFFEFADKLPANQVPTILRMIRERWPEQWNTFRDELP